MGRTPFTSRQDKKQTLTARAGHFQVSPNQPRPQEKKVGLISSTEHKTQDTISLQSKEATCVLVLVFFSPCRKTEGSSDLHRSTEGHTEEPVKYLLFLNYFKNGCCRRGDKRQGREEGGRPPAPWGQGRHANASPLTVGHGTPYPHSLSDSSGACMQSGTGIRSCPLCSHRPADSPHC